MAHKQTATKLTRKLRELFGEHTEQVSPCDVDRAMDLMTGSEEATAKVIPYINHVLKQANLKNTSTVKEGPTKKLLRIFAKAVTQYNSRINDVPDIGRIRVEIETPEDIIALRKAFLGNVPQYNSNGRIGLLQDAHPTNDIAITEFEDFFRVPSSTGRMGLHIGLEVKLPGKDKVKFEIQILHKGMIQTEDFTRDNYERAQMIKRAARNEGRQLTPNEAFTVKSYDTSSRERYTADGIKFNLIKLRRPDLIARHKADLPAPRLTVIGPQVQVA